MTTSTPTEGFATAGDWVLQGTLGEGAHGTVYDAVHAKDGRRAAVKVLKATVDASSGGARMEREARILGTLRHPGIVEVLDTGSTLDGRPFVVMPLLKGDTLRAWLDAHPDGTSATHAWTLVRPIAAALQAAHTAGVIHRDVKPENIFLEASGPAPAPRLIDFGLARADAQEPRLTATGVLVGTPLYMPPEQWWNQPPSVASDQYALACVLFEVVTGRPAFGGSSLAQVLRAHTEGTPPSLILLRPNVPEALSAALLKAMSRDAGARFPSMQAFMDAVDAALGMEKTARPAWLIPMLWCAACLLATWLPGYAREHLPVQIIRLAGWGAWPILALCAVGMVAACAGRSMAAWVALGAAMFGTFGTSTGWLQVMKALDKSTPANAFLLLHEGMLEANVNRWAACSMASGVLAALLLQGWDWRLPAPRTPLSMGGILVLVMAVASWALGLGDATWVCLTGAAVLMLGPRGRTRDEELRHALLRPLAVGLAAAGAVARGEGALASVWGMGLSRAERAVEVTRLDGLQGALWVVCVLALLICIVAAVAELRRLEARNGVGVPAGTRWMLAGWMAWLCMDVAAFVWVARYQNSAWEGLAPIFASWTRLDPPRRDGLPEPALAPALRIARDVVAVDSDRVGLTAALASKEGTAALAQDLSHRLARSPEALDAPVQLLCIVDQDVRWNAASHGLGVAFGLGVKRVQFLFTRGPAPRFSASAPAEAAFAIPADFGALNVVLSDVDGLAPPPNATAGSVGELLNEGTVLRVAR